jgi:hypothetical protein
MSNHKPIPELTESDLERFWSKVNRGAPDDCWLWVGTVVNEYGQFKMVDGFGYKANRISYAIAKDDPGVLLVCHTCDTPLCMNPAHLWLGTTQDNNHDSLNKGRRPKREQHGKAKLTEEAVQDIRDSNELQRVLAARYEVNQSAISKIKCGTNWPTGNNP